MNYSGLVRAKQRCHIGGFAYKPGDVFEVRNLTLWDDDPFEPCAFVRFEEESIAVPPWTRRVAHYARINVALLPATLRLAPEQRVHAGLRRPYDELIDAHV